MRTFLIIILGLFVLVFISQGFATTVVALSLQQATQKAEQIFYGRVVLVQPAEKKYHTRIIVQSEFNVKGQQGSVIEFQLPVGVDRETGTARLIPGMPRFVEGQEVVLFLEQQKKNSRVRLPVGLGQGVYDVALDAASGKKYVTRSSLQDLNLVSAQTGRLVPAPIAQRQDLDEFLAQLAELVAKEEGR